MKKLIAAVCLVPELVFGGNAKNIKDHLNETFDVDKVTIEKKVLRVVMNENIITQDIYQSVFENGMLLYTLGYGETTGALKGIKGFIIMNKTETQGFAFSGDRDEILKFGEYDRKKLKMMLFSKSIVYVVDK